MVNFVILLNALNLRFNIAYALVNIFVPMAKPVVFFGWQVEVQTSSLDIALILSSLFYLMKV